MVETKRKWWEGILHHPFFISPCCFSLDDNGTRSESGFASGHNGGDTRHAPLFMLSISGLSPDIYLQIRTMAHTGLVWTMDSEPRLARFFPINASRSLCSPQHNFVLASPLRLPAAIHHSRFRAFVQPNPQPNQR